VSYKIAPMLTAGLGTGVFSLDVSHFAKNYTMPLGVNAIYKLDAHMQVGAA